VVGLVVFSDLTGVADIIGSVFSFDTSEPEVLAPVAFSASLT
jgi:hypothetical protein